MGNIEAFAKELFNILQEHLCSPCLRESSTPFESSKTKDEDVPPDSDAERDAALAALREDLAQITNEFGIRFLTQLMRNSGTTVHVV